MKRLLPLLTLGLFLAVPAARAHDESKEMGPDHHDMAGHMDMIKKDLGLTDDQAKKFEDAKKAHMDNMHKVHEDMEASMRALRQQVQGKASDADIQKTLDQLSAVHKAMQAEHDRFLGSVSFLTPTQKAKIFMHMMGGMHHGMGMEGKHGMHHEMHGDKDMPANEGKDDDKD